MEKVWVVTEWFPGNSREPIVSTFDNAKAAEKYARYIKASRQPSHCCIDEAPVFSDFKFIDPEKEEMEG